MKMGVHSLKLWILLLVLNTLWTVSEGIKFPHLHTDHKKGSRASTIFGLPCSEEQGPEYIGLIVKKDLHLVIL